MRGWLYSRTVWLSVLMAAVLLPAASAVSAKAILAVSVYSLSMSALFGTSTVYRGRQWGYRGWQVMKRLDQTIIFVFIAGSYRCSTRVPCSLPWPTTWPSSCCCTTAR